MKVYQDGRRFYADETTGAVKKGDCIFTAPFAVRDSDFAAAEEARRAFERWAIRGGLSVEIVDF